MKLYEGESWYGSDAPVWALIGLLLALMLLVAGLLASPRAQACDQPNFYDPAHQICAPYPPAYPEPGYPPEPWQFSPDLAPPVGVR